MGKGDHSLILRWHSRHIAIEDSPRTDTIPGAGNGVEHSEHVGMKLLFSIQGISHFVLMRNRLYLP